MRNVIYFLAFLAIAVQLPTAADVFLATFSLKFIDPNIKWGLAYGYALVFETSLLIFVLQKRHAYAFVFAFFSLLINLISHDLFPWLTASSAFLISIQLPIAIGIYSKELERLNRRADEEKQEKEKWRAEQEARMEKIRNNPPPRNSAKSVMVAPSQVLTQAMMADTPSLATRSNGHSSSEVSIEYAAGVPLLKEVIETPAPNCTCENCGTAFYSKTGKGRFCKDKCRAAIYRKNNSPDNEN